MRRLVSIVVPCFNESDTVHIFYSEVTKILDSMNNSVEYELLFINDGSRDDTLEQIRRIKNSHPEVALISFSRNFGKEPAMLAGLELAKGDAVVIMDADLQDPPGLLTQMIEDWISGYDVVYTRRVDRRGEPPIRSWFAKKFYSLINLMSDVEIIDGARDYRLMDRKVVNSILQMRERLRFSKGLFAWVGYKSKCIEFENINRVAGTSSWSFLNLFNYAIEGIVSFTYIPLRIASLVGIITAACSFLYMLKVIVDKIINGNPVSGYPSMVSIILFFGGIQILFLGIIGEYLGRIFYEVKARPHYIIQEYSESEVICKKDEG